MKQLNDLPDKKAVISCLWSLFRPELAIQVATFKAFVKYSPKKIKMISLIGGESIEDQIRGLRANRYRRCYPGRLLEIMRRGEIHGS